MLFGNNTRAIVTVVLLVIAVTLFSIDHFAKSETWAMFRAYLKAQKERVCPIIEIVEDPEKLSS